MGGRVTQQGINVQYDLASWLITLVGVLLGIAGVTYIVTHPEPLTVWAVELTLVSVPATAIVYGGYWIAAHQLPKENRLSIAKWSLAGAGIAALLLFGYIGIEQLDGATIIDAELLLILGALGGALVTLVSTISTEQHHLDVAISTTDRHQLEAAGVEAFSAEAQTLAKLVVDTRSWYVVRVLQLAEEPLGVEAIASQIASIERTDPQGVHIDLVHNRLPKLADEGLVTYRADVEVVRLTDRVTTVANASEELSAARERLTTVTEQS